MPKRLILAVVLMLTALAPLATGEERNFGVLEMDSIQAREAGIGHIRLVREGPEDNQAEWVLNVDVFDLEGHLSGAVEIRYPSPDVTESSFAPAGSSEVYRIRSDEAARFFRIEHVGVETVTFRPLCDPAELTVQGKRYTGEELEELRLQQLECAKQIEVTGTSKTWQEAAEHYEEISEYLAAVNSRLREFFGILTTKKRELQERLERVERESQQKWEQLESQESTGSTSGFRSLPQNFTFCGPEEVQYCAADDLNFSVLGEGSCFNCTTNDCCTEASESADINCLVSTYLPCCANSLCQVTSPLSCGIWCNCQLIGFTWACRHCV